MKPHYISINNTIIYVREFKSDGEAIFLLHPGGTNGHIWDDVIQYFINKYHVIVMDMRGHGQSSIPTEGYSMTNQAADIIGVMDYLRIENAHLIGNSLGTDVAVHTASMFPDRISSLVNIDAGMLDFIGSNGENDGTKDEWVKKSLNRTIVDFGSREEFSEFIREKYSFLGEEYVKSTSKNTPLRSLSNGRLTHMMPNEVNALLMEAFCDMKFELCYPSIKCPVLFLPAPEEAKLEEKLEIVEKYGKYLPWYEVKVIEGTDHIPLKSHPYELGEIINNFISKVGSPVV